MPSIITLRYINSFAVFNHRYINYLFLVKCVACHKWVHKRCSGISGRLGYVADFRCRRCLDGDSAQVLLSSEVELEPGVKV